MNNIPIALATLVVATQCWLVGGFVQQSAIWLDGIPTTVLPLPDRGLDYGDGLFETLLLHDGKPLFTELHLERMAQGLWTLGLAHAHALGG